MRDGRHGERKFQRQSRFHRHEQSESRCNGRGSIGTSDRFDDGDDGDDCEKSQQTERAVEFRGDAVFHNVGWNQSLVHGEENATGCD